MHGRRIATLLGLLAGLSINQAAAQTQPTINTNGPVSCGTSGGAVSCSSAISSSSSLPVTVALTNGQNTSSPTNYTLQGTATGAGPTQNSYGTVLSYSGYGTVPSNTYPSLAYVQGPNITINDSAAVTVNGASGYPVGYAFNTGGVVTAASFGSEGFIGSGSNLNQGNFNGSQGGAVVVDMSGSIDAIGNGSNNAVTGQYLAPTLSGIGAFSFGGQGVAAKVHNSDYAGTGGAGGMIQVNNTGHITLSNTNDTPTYGIFAASVGGLGSNQTNYATGPAGDGGEVDVTHSGSIVNSAPNGIGIVAQSLGGPSDDTQIHNNNDSSAPGNGGPVNVTVSGGGSLTLQGGATSIGILALSAGGNAGNSVDVSGGNVTVNIDPGSTITTSGSALSIGVLAVSSGSVGAVLPFQQQVVSSANPGSPGQVSVTNGGSISTSGSMAIGIAAVAVGGSSIVTNASSGSNVLGVTGEGFGGISGNTVSVSNTGTITTLGDAAFGIAAVSVGGGGGLLNQASGAGSTVVGSQTSNTSQSNGGSVTVTNSGTITTGSAQGGGTVAIGIVAQSIGGGGGSSSATASRVGGGDASGSGGGDGGAVDVNITGHGGVTTFDDGAIGILAQSVGGGGGNGANSAGVFVAVGGNGGNGGAGGAVDVTLGGTGGLSTAGQFAAGIIAQSVGGGGGNGGSGTSGGLFVDAAIGGAAGSGGDGGAVMLTNSQNVVTAGQNSLGVLAQSIGGGGGNGGAATGIVGGVAFTTAIAIGGVGGDGGSGGPVTVDNNYHITTSGPDAIGLIAQSIGGGGGTGGASVAQSLAISVPDVPTFAFTASVGGNAGGGGNGGAVTINNAGQIITSGDGAHGLLAQSIGGGGGNGGDSTATSHAIPVDGATAQLTVALGATGGSGGSGGPVTIISGSSATCGGCVSQTSTGGQDAAGLEAQSIGGGGGNSTPGNAGNDSANIGDTDQGDQHSTGDTFGLSIGLGASGGAGGAGGAVTVTVDPSNTISTTGSGSPGILAQSIGGGGGGSSGGSFGGSVNYTSLNISAGGVGVGGSTGGAVSVTNGGAISTSGGDSIGILAQSIGGGGGLAGSSDAAASVSASNQAENVITVPSDDIGAADVAVGGKGGSGGNAGNTAVTNSGPIATGGERAYGIEAQSIGGGGGNGGAAIASSTGSTNESYSDNVAVGGSGGAAGDGGQVSVTSSGAITTAGYNAHGILAQSIGGGGGVGGDGSVSSSTTMSVGAGVDGNGGGSGMGGDVSVTTKTGGTITTLGDDAVGILAESIGGGGGTATSGCTNSGSAGIATEKATACFGNVGLSASTNGPAAFFPRSDFSLNVGGGAGAGGNGLDVAVEVADAIVTTGARSIGIVAQSIGGGGGYAPGAAQNISGTSVADSPGSNGATGGPVTVTLASTGSITTSGAGAWGILAQSIGGGGGFAGDPSLALATPASNTLPRTGNGNAFANTVALAVDGNITTTGANAHGVFAQAIGGSGGIVAGCCNSTTSQVLAGNTAQFRNGSQGSYYGDGGAISVTQGAGSTIRTSGFGSIGIVAQSSGNSAANNAITVTLGGAVIGGTNGGAPVPGGLAGAAGILLSGGGAAANPNSITVASSGSVGTVDGVAGTGIIANDGVTDVTNGGTITGSIDLGATPGAIDNTGALYSGATIVTSLLTNAGTLNVAGAGTIGTTALSGDLAQTSTGTLDVDIDVLAPQRADLLTVSGNAQIAGSIVPTATALLPGALTVATAGSLASTATVRSSLLFDWSAAATGTTLAISPSSNFTPRGLALTASEASLAGYLTTAWNASDASFAKKFGFLSQLQAGGDYTATLDAFSPKAAMAQATALANGSATVLGAPLSCPVFVDGGVLLGENDCAWAKVTGQSTSQYSTTDTLGYQTSGTTFRLGAQHEVAPSWFVGGSLATGLTWADESGGSSGHGQTFDGSIAVKHVMGPWLIAGSIGLASGSFHNDRVIDLPGVNAVLQSHSSVFLAGGRLRGAYEFAFDHWYVRPYGDLDVVYSDIPSFHESGAGDYALDVRGSGKVNAVISPMVEVGGRVDVSAKTVLRPYVAVGMSFLPDNTRATDASFATALPGDGTFRTFTRSPDVLGNLELGAQVYRVGGLELKAEYGVKVGGAYLAQGGGARVAYHF